MDFGLFTTPALTAVAFLGLSALDSRILPIATVTVSPSFEYEGYSADRLESDLEYWLEDAFREAKLAASGLGGDPLYPSYAIDVYYLDHINWTLHIASNSMGLCAQYLTVFLSEHEGTQRLNLDGETRRCQPIRISAVLPDTRSLAELLDAAASELLVELDPYVAALHHMRRELAERSFPKTREAIRRGLLHDARALDKQLFVLWGRIEQIEGRPEMAADKYRRALEIDPAFAHAHHQWGRLHAAQGDHAAAEKSYRTALMLDARYGAAQADLGEALRAQGRNEEAAEAQTLAEKTSPQDPYVFIRRGLSLMADGDGIAAVASLREAARLAPKSPYVEKLLTRALAVTVPDFHRLEPAAP